MLVALLLCHVLSSRGHSNNNITPMTTANMRYICHVQSSLFWEKFIIRQAKHSPVYSGTSKLSQLKPLAHILKVAFVYLLGCCVHHICITQSLTTVVTLNKKICTCVPLHNSDGIRQLIISNRCSGLSGLWLIDMLDKKSTLSKMLSCSEKGAVGHDSQLVVIAAAEGKRM